MPRARLNDVQRLQEAAHEIETAAAQVAAAPISQKRKRIVLTAFLEAAAQKRAMQRSLATPPQRERRSLSDHHLRLGGARFVDLFRFNYEELPTLMVILQIPAIVSLPGRGSLSGADVMGILLHMLAYPNTHTREADFWGLCEADICEAYNWAVSHVATTYVFIERSHAINTGDLLIIIFKSISAVACVVLLLPISWLWGCTAVRC